MIPNCHICDRENKSWGSLVKHAAQTHGVKAEDYFTSYLGTKPNCIHCGSSATRFLSVGEGFTASCKECSKQHQAHVAKVRRQRLKEDPVAYKQFIDRLSDSVSDVWANRDLNEKQKILSKFRNTGKPTLGLKNFDPVKEEIRLENNYKALAKQLKLDVDFSKTIAPQLALIVDNNLTKLFGFDDGARY